MNTRGRQATWVAHTPKTLLSLEKFRWTETTEMKWKILRSIIVRINIIIIDNDCDTRKLSVSSHHWVSLFIREALISGVEYSTHTGNHEETLRFKEILTPGGHLWEQHRFKWGEIKNIICNSKNKSTITKHIVNLTYSFIWPSHLLEPKMGYSAADSVERITNIFSEKFMRPLKQLQIF